MRWFRAACLLVWVGLVTVMGAFGQGTTATVRGVIADPDNAVIPGATVTFTPTTGRATIVTSQADGSYVSGELTSGTYSLTVTMQGFSTFVRQTLRLAGGQQLTVDVRLAIQEQSQEIQVNAQSNQLSVDADSNASSTTIKDKDLDALSDDPDELSSELSALAGPSVGPSGGQIYVDGFTGGQLPPKSSIREVRINQNPFSAQYDKLGFGRVEVFTKPGTDKFHGNYSIQGNDKSFNTSNPFLGAANQQPDYHTLFMLGSITGPINHFSSFSFGGSHRDIQDNSIVNPTAFYATSGASTDPCAPGSGLNNGSGCMLLSGYPLTARAVFHPQTRSDLTPRVDVALGAKNTLTVRYQYNVNGQQNAGIGNTSLPSVGYSTETTEHTVQVSDTQLFGSKVVNETRFEYQRNASSQTPNSTAPTLSVQGIFTAGGSSQGSSSSTGYHLEVQNYTSIQRAKHFIRTGGRLRLDQSTLTSNAGSNGTFSYASLTDYVNGRVNLFRQTLIRNATVSGTVGDVGLYLEDEWKVRPNLTLTAGIRYEAQNAINSAHDIAPRLGIAYGIPRRNGQTTTVLRLGYGIFYDRFPLENYLTTQQLNGSNQISNVVQTPSSACSPGTITACGQVSGILPTTYTLGGNTRSAYEMFHAAGVDQQVGKVGSISVNYLYSQGIHQYLSRAFVVGNALGRTGYSDQFQSAGFDKQHSVYVNGNVRARTVTLFGFYALNFAQSNTTGATSFATNPYNSRTDYGQGGYVHRSFGVIGGNWALPRHFSVAPFLLAQSGTFYNVTSGVDTNQDGQINDRPYYANGRSGSCVNAADYSVTNTTGTLPLVPAYSCAGPANMTVNLRFSKTIGLGPLTERAKESRQGGGGPNGPPPGGGRGGPGGGGRGPGGGGPGGPGGFMSGSNTGHKYNLTLGAQGMNIFNQVPYGTPNSVIGPEFGRFTTLAGGPFSSSTAVRRITLQANFTF